MAPQTAQSRRFHAERRLAWHHHAQRSTLFGRDDSSNNSTSTSTSTSQPVASLPHGTSALIGVVVFLAVIVLSFAAWRFYVYRSNKKSDSSRNSKHEGLFDAVEEKLKRSFSKSSGLTLPQPAVTRERSPSEFKVNLGYEPKVIFIAPQQNEPKTEAPGSNLQIITPPPYQFNDSQTPLSPRTVASIAPKLPPIPSARLPRLVVVESTFQATLHDELEVRVGEVLRLLEEYEDEWCLVQRVGPKDAERGVVPRFCVVDKPASTPAQRGAHVPRLSSSDVKF